MYTLVSAIGEPLGGGNRWRAVEIGDMPVAQIYSTYAGCIATLSNSFLPQPVALDLFAVQDQYAALELTFNQLLASLGNNALPTSNTLPVLNTRYAKYADAFHAGYKVQPIHPSWAADAQVPPAEKTWLHLTKPGVDYNLFKQSCLISVNGLYHYTDSDSNGIYVTEGDRSRQVSKANTIGIYSFRELGSLKCIPITPAMVYKQRPEQQLRHRAYLNVGQDLSNVTVMLVLGGYLHAMDSKTLWRTGNQGLGVNFEAIPLLERYFESRRFLDLSALQLQVSSVNPWQVGIDDLFSDDVLTRYLTLSQSFIVLVSNPNLFVDHVPLRTTRNPGAFIADVTPRYPLIAGYGLQPNYWYTYEDREWSITTVAGVLDNPLYRTVDAMAQRSVSDSRDPLLRHRFAAARFLQIGTDL